MSGRNDEVNGMAMGAAVIVALAFAMFAVVYALLVFGAILLTIWCVFALFKPVTLFGNTVEPEEARTFIFRGLIVGGLVCAFAAFSAAIFRFEIEEDYWGYIFWGGYALGSLGIELLIANNEETTLEIVHPPITAREKPPQIAPPMPERPFEFARWDDEG